MAVGLTSFLTQNVADLRFLLSAAILPVRGGAPSDPVEASTANDVSGPDFSGRAAEGNTQPQQAATPVEFSELRSKAGVAWSNALESRLADEISPHVAVQAILLVDGGSSKTQPVLFRIETEARPGQPRLVRESSIKMMGEGTKLQGVRDILEQFLDATVGRGWESRPLESDELTGQFLNLETTVAGFVGDILEETATMLEEKLSQPEKDTVKALGVPVVFNSTAGIRDFAWWLADGLFVAIRRIVNTYPQVKGYKFYTDPTLSRTLSGEEEGVSAFLTANLLLGHFKELRQDVARGLVTRAHEKLAGIIEVGGASMQIVFPVPVTTLLPASVQTVDMQKGGYLSPQYPPVHLLAISYMQLGANSASGIFLKGLCSDPQHLKHGTCYNPCLLRNFEQECSAGPVTITSKGEVTVNKDLKKNRLKPLATFCGSANEDLTRRQSTRLTCLAVGVSPTGKSLRERVEIPRCRKIVGTGNFEECTRKVESLLLNSPLALPANSEAEGMGFDAPGQIFSTLSSSAPLLVTGAALVFPLRNLMKLGLLPESFSGDSEQLQQAASKFCSAPMERDGDKLVVKVGEKALDITSFSYEDCLRLGFTQGLLARVNAGKEKPRSVTFSTKVEDPETGKVLGSGGWPVGRIFKETQNHRDWSLRAYENGPTYSYGLSKM